MFTVLLCLADQRREGNLGRTSYRVESYESAEK